MMYRDRILGDLFSIFYENIFENQLKLFILVCISLASVLLVRKYVWDISDRYPPGPRGLPIFGYVQLLYTNPHQVCHKLFQQYGNIIRVKILGTNIILIGDYEIAKYVMSHDQALMRPHRFMQLFPALGGVGGQSGEEWYQQRKVLMTAMRTLGMGKGPWEYMVQTSVGKFVQELELCKGEPTYFQKTMMISHIDSLMVLLTGQRLSTKPSGMEELEFISNLLEYQTNYVQPTGLATNAPLYILKLLKFLRIGGYDEIFLRIDKLTAIFQREIDRHLESSDEEEENNIISCYLNAMKAADKAGVKHYLSVENLCGNMEIVTLAASVTTSASLIWLFYLVAAHPEIQEKVHGEIDSSLPQKTMIWWEDRLRMPYVWAVILEMARWRPVVELTPPRQSSEDICAGKYVIPKGSTISSCTKQMFRNADIFRDPDEFNPERLMHDDEDKTKEKILRTAPFSFGKRNCPGDAVGLMEIFIYFVTIMQNFRLSPVEGEKISFEGGIGLTNYPLNTYRLCFVKR